MMHSLSNKPLKPERTTAERGRRSETNRQGSALIYGLIEPLLVHFGPNGSSPIERGQGRLADGAPSPGVMGARAKQIQL